MHYDQREFDIRCEWGEPGIARLASISDAIVIVDVLSFSTSVDIAVANGADVYPYDRRDESAAAYARTHDAVLAGAFDAADSVYSLSPASLLGIPAGTRLVLPSPNGATLSLATGQVPTLAGCLRNAEAVARAALAFGPRIGVVPAGERWPEGSLRAALEDWIGAGAVVHYLTGSRSPEAKAAAAMFRWARTRLGEHLSQCSSGKECRARGRARDVDLAAALNVSSVAPILRGGAYALHPAGAGRV